MSNEVQLSYRASASVYFRIHSPFSGTIWNSSGGVGAFESYNSVNYPNYALSTVQLGTSGGSFYQGSFPSALPAGKWNVVALQQLGGSPVESDPVVAAGDEQWNGTKVLPLSDLATSGQISSIGPLKIQRGTMVKPFEIYLVSAADHVTPFTSGIVSGQISRDGGNFTALQSGAITEVGLGFFSLQALTSGDLNCNAAALLFTANGISGGQSDPRPYTFVMQRSSGN